MKLKRSRFVHIIPLAENRILIVHATRHTRLPADKDVRRLLVFFENAHELEEASNELAQVIPYSKESIEAALRGLVERGILTSKNSDEEMQEISEELSPTHGRDPSELLENYRRKNQEGGSSYWATGAAFQMDDFAASARRVDVLLLGDCDLHMETDFLRQEARRHGVDLHVAASFANDVRFASDRRHEAVFLGALRSRHSVIDQNTSGQPHALFIAHVESLLKELRGLTSAPILIDNLPEPTVQPLGIAEVGARGHRTRFRAANVALSDVASQFSDVYVVDIAAALGQAGSALLLDDGQVGFTHFGSPGWMLQRPESEKKAVHNLFPDTTLLAQSLGGNPYLRESTAARAHIDVLMTVLAIGRKKCIILDLDGTLWPGVLAETGSPFAWTPETSGPFSYIGLYFGLHEALLCLKERGVLLACVSKNDENLVRDLWRYPDPYPKSRLLTLSDFVSIRINWDDKVENIRSIADELGFALDTFLFIDDHPVERDRVRARLSEVEVWGDNPFDLRRRLLQDPRLQTSVITTEAKTRTELTKAQIQRQAVRKESATEIDYLQTLGVKTDISEVTGTSSSVPRICELLDRTTQFNTTGKKFSEVEILKIAQTLDAHVFVLHVSDKFGDQGLVGAAVIQEQTITALVMSCRVLGMGVEQSFLDKILERLRPRCQFIRAQIIETSRNTPVRHVYSDAGFIQENQFWTYTF